MAKKAEPLKHSIEGIVTETYPYAESESTRLRIDAENTGFESFVPAKFGSKLKPGSKVMITLEVIPDEEVETA